MSKEKIGHGVSGHVYKVQDASGKWMAAKVFCVCLRACVCGYACMCMCIPMYLCVYEHVYLCTCLCGPGSHDP